MTVHLGSVRYPFAPQHPSPSVLFQFVMSEFFIAHAQVLQLRELGLQTDIGHDKQSFDPFATCLSQLTGVMRGHMHIFPWSIDGGILHKLQHYLQLFHRHGNLAEVPSLKMQSLVHKAWLSAVENLELLRRWSGGERPSLRSKALFHRNIKRIHICFQHFSLTMIQLIPDFRDDENVLFFLLRNQKNFNMSFGSHFLKKTLTSLFPDGLEQLEKFLISQYVNRSFLHLPTQISEYIAALNTSQYEYTSIR